MKTIIAGPRTGAPDLVLEDAMAYWLGELNQPITGVVSGNARGVDRQGEGWAERRDIPIQTFPYLSHLGKRGGYARNCQMADYADACVALWNHKRERSGTFHMMRIAYKKGLDMLVWLIPDNEPVYYRTPQNESKRMEKTNGHSRSNPAVP